MVLFIIFFLINNSFSCEVQLFESYIVTSNIKNFIAESDCSDEENIQINSILKNSQGTIQTELLIKNGELSHIKLTPSILKIYNITDILKNNIEFDVNKRPSNINFLSENKDGLLLNEKCIIEISCQNCTNKTNNNFKLKCNNQNIFWGKFDIEEYTLSFKANMNIPPFTQLEAKHAIQSYSWIPPSEQDPFSGDSQSLFYYKTNKMITEGSIIKSNDLTPLILTNSHQQVKVLFNTNGIKISTTGTSLKNGKLGDYISVKNDKTGITYIGKVVGQQTVEIKL